MVEDFLNRLQPSTSSVEWMRRAKAWATTAVDPDLWYMDSIDMVEWNLKVSLACIERAKKLSGEGK